MTSSDAMIAINAEFATDSPKLGPISSTFGFGLPKSSCRAALTASTSTPSSVEIWTTFGPSVSLSSVWIFASARPSGAIVSRTWSTVAARSSGAVMRAPPSKSMPKLMPLADIAKAQTSRMHAGRGEEPLRLAHVVDLELVLLLAGAERPRRAEQARVAQRVQDRLRREHRGQQRQDDAETEGEGEALDARGREDEEDERDQERDDVRVDDRRQALAVTRDDRGADRSSGPHLLLHAFEDRRCSRPRPRRGSG